ncbi:hypothetical protein TG4357_02032 [Thalassovita gelatinovora]|uniref:Uncharacterized protein n=1 Tax=Thalassovita gelatinovora TaxID=53501 RepID=A0A0P1G0P8_THAGE|nr:hypothetical protein [Thalassovita gelatinovora]QIZ80036.1 hypothetical protein HFZ77_05835 [Thalassovita gelatinovora]CUH65740.1 hypothetical protein TG4357_02032 [Thalassovita gelatinovora]SER04097.1 hypothetical protein SAMN04488043_11421 [Thalassovita gelatinovora]
MSSLTADQWEAILTRALAGKLGELARWEKPKFGICIGPDGSKLFDEFESRVFELKAELEAFLNAQDEVWLTGFLYDPNPMREMQQTATWLGFLREEIKKLHRVRPPDVAGGFGHPNFRADFDYWAKVNYFTVNEALLLSFGVEPKHFGDDELSALKEAYEKGTSLWQPIQYLIRRRDQFVRQFPYALRKGRIMPLELFDWFRLVDLPVHPEFTSHYCNSASDGPDVAGTEVPKKTHRREVDTISQLFTAMAIEYFGYAPAEKRSPVPKEIVDLAASMGIQITDETVLKYLRVGASFISDDWRRDKT